MCPLVDNKQGNIVYYIISYYLVLYHESGCWSSCILKRKKMRTNTVFYKCVMHLERLDIILYRVILYCSIVYWICHRWTVGEPCWEKKHAARCLEGKVIIISLGPSVSEEPVDTHIYIYIYLYTHNIYIYIHTYIYYTYIYIYLGP